MRQSDVSKQNAQPLPPGNEGWPVTPEMAPQMANGFSPSVATPVTPPQLRKGLATRPVPSENAILAGLGESTIQQLLPHLEPVRLPARMRLDGLDADGRKFRYFLTSGLASCVIADKSRESVEFALIGREGTTVFACGLQNAAMRAEMLTSGAAMRIDAGVLDMLVQELPDLKQALLAFGEDLLCQSTMTLLAAARYSVRERVARWLLIATARAMTPSIPVTHDMIATALGVRRAGVTLALKALRDRGGIVYGRREVAVVDRSILIPDVGGAWPLNRPNN